MMTAYIQYQNATTEDLSDLLLLEDLCFSKSKSYRKVLKRYFLSQIAHCIVAKLEDRVVGYVLSVFSPNMKTATIQALCVHPRLRQQGIGENLLNWIEVEALQSGASQIGIEILYENDTMRYLLQENGFQETSDPVTLIPAYKDGVKMRKRLTYDFEESVTIPNQVEIELSTLNADHFSIQSH